MCQAAGRLLCVTKSQVKEEEESGFSHLFAGNVPHISTLKCDLYGRRPFFLNLKMADFLVTFPFSSFLPSL
jgi:hypothetical protein